MAITRSMAEKQKRLRMHAVSETAFGMKGQGVHTAFVDCVDLLRSRNDVDVVVGRPPGRC